MDNSLAPLPGPAAMQAYRPTGESTYHLRDVVGALRERLIVFVLVAAVIAAPAIWLVTSLPPSYVATTRLLIEPNERMRLNIDSAVGGIALDNESVRSEVEVLKSPRLAQRVIEKLQSRITADLDPEKRGVFLALSQLREWLGLSRPPDQAPVTQFLRRLTITPVERSRVIVVAYRAHDPELAAEVANTLADEYVDMALELKREGTREAADWLAGRIRELQLSIDASERSIEAYRQEHGLVQGDGTGLVTERLNRTNLALSQASNRLAEITSRLNRLNEPIDPGQMAEVLNSELIRQLRAQEADLARRIAETATVMGSGSSTLIGQRNALASVQRSIASEIGRIRAGIEDDAASARSLQAALQREAASLIGDLNRLRRATIDLRAMERDAGATRAIYENVLLRTKDVIAQETFLFRDARVIGHALPPPSPTGPSRLVLFAGSVLAGLIAAAGVVRLIVHFEPGFRRIRDIERATRVSVLSAIPKVSGVGPKRNFGGTTSKQQRSRLAASIDMLLGRVMLGRSGGRGMVLTVTSCIEGEGKTFVTLGLAHLAARIGHRCLVIDGDFRSPWITRSLKLNGHAGLSEVLDGSQPASAAASWISESGIHVLPVGRSTMIIQRLIGSPVYRSMIDKLTQEFDLIIIDTSPVTAAAEPEILAQVSDQTLLVVQWRRTPRALVQDVVERLSKATGSIAGIALTQVLSRQRASNVYGDM